MKNKILGFTISELIITTVLMSVVMILAPVVTLKRNVKPDNVKDYNLVKCESKCIYRANDNTIITPSGEKQLYDRKKNSGDFYIIELTGGGGGGSATDCGLDGEDSTLFLPSLTKNMINPANVKTGEINGILTGYYLLEVGTGGSAAQSGSASVVCVITESESKTPLASLSCNGKTVVAKAAGGISSNQNNSSCNPPLEKGKGGRINSSGMDGIIEIK